MRLAVFTDSFPELSETFIVTELDALLRAGCEVRVEASRRALSQDLAAARAHRVSYAEDDSPGARLLALLWLVVRHPLGCLRDLGARRRWRREEPVAPLRAIASPARRVARHRDTHLHVHFAAGAALTAMRIAAITGRPFSVTAHAYDIFQRPRNLREKLERAAFATTGCQYNVDYLRRLAPAANLHELVMGVDPDRFRRSAPAAGGRRIAAVGRLVEKKGFADLIEAIAILARNGSDVEALEIAGEGPLRQPLEAQIARLGLEGTVRLTGALQNQVIRETLERAGVFVMPCVIASDGDRDSMPVAVKEAMALELPVVATDEVGLPELVDDEVGQLVPPRDPEALAAAIEQILALPASERSRLGQAGRARVIERCSAEQQAADLLALVTTGQLSVRCR